MLDRMSGFWQRRRRSKLYKQWVEKDGLSPEEVPQDLLQGGKERPPRQPPDESGSSFEGVLEEQFPGDARPQYVNKGHILVPVRYVILGGGLVVLLLVVLAVVLTVFVMRSC